MQNKTDLLPDFHVSRSHTKPAQASEVSSAGRSADVEILRFDNAVDFLAALASPLQVLEGAYDPSTWLFRGLKDASFELRPSALRDSVGLLSFRDRIWTQENGLTEWEHIRNEMFTIHAFCRRADSEGIALPEDSRKLREDFNTWLERDHRAQGKALAAGDWYWPPDTLLSICGLAQHYGLPTRLLDWSYSPLVACYFAAVGAAKDVSAGRPRKSEDLCVWALSDKAIGITDMITHTSRGTLNSEKARLVRVTAPTASNANLRAQRGVFVLIRPECVIPEAPLTRWDLREIVHLLVKVEGPALKQYLLAATEAPQLLRMLAQHFVSAASVYPGVPGVIEGLREEWIWDQRVSGTK